MLMVISSAVKALAGALVMELGTGVFGMPRKISVADPVDLNSGDDCQKTGQGTDMRNRGLAEQIC